MGSINAQRVGIKVLENIGKNKRVNLGRIIEEAGYSKNTALTPTLVTNTKSYQQAIELEKIPLIEGLQREINEVKLAMSKKNKNKEEYRTLVGAMDILTKNYQLLTGGVTSRNVLVLPSEVMDKNNIQSSDDKTVQS